MKASRRHIARAVSSQEWLTQGTVTSTTRREAHPSGCARCGAGAGFSAIKYQSSSTGDQLYLKPSAFSCRRRMPSSSRTFVALLVAAHDCQEREFFIDNLLVRIHFQITDDLVDKPRAMGVCFPGILASTFQVSCANHRAIWHPRLGCRGA